MELIAQLNAQTAVLQFMEWDAAESDTKFQAMATSMEQRFRREAADRESALGFMKDLARGQEQDSLTGEISRRPRSVWQRHPSG